MISKSEHLERLHHWYPSATTTSDSVDALLDLIERKLSLQPNQIMSADSICCDDINSIEYPQRAYEMLGPFKMGGLNGFPFAGLTGMGAFAHHVPEDGALFIFYGPHIGLTKTGNIGEILRDGQSTSSSCCGAATAALNKLLKDEIKDADITELDYQQNTLEQILFRSKERVMSSAEPIVEATEVIYEAIDERMRILIEHTKIPCEHVIRMGAVLINGDFDIGSFSACRTLTCSHRSTGQVENWMPEFAAVMRNIV